MTEIQRFEDITQSEVETDDEFIDNFLALVKKFNTEVNKLYIERGLVPIGSLRFTNQDGEQNINLYFKGLLNFEFEIHFIDKIKTIYSALGKKL